MGGSAIITISEMEIPNFFVIITIMVTSFSSGIFGCAPLATAIFVSLICQKLSDEVQLLSADLLFVFFVI